jgi:hypothetical protein
MENQITIVNPKEFGLEENKALELTSGLKTILAEREVLKNAYVDVIALEITQENLPTFKDLRIRIRDNRTKGIETWHKKNKEFFLTGGRFVDAIKNKEIAENERMENKLLEAEKHFENLEKERLKSIHNERVKKLLPFDYEIGTIDYSAMDDRMFTAILLGAETSYKAKLEAERLAEEKRLETLRIEAEEKEKQRLEFERLKAENEAKEKQLEAERLEAKKIEAELKAKADKLQAELKAKADTEAKEKQRIEAEEKAREIEAKNKAKAPDKEKLKTWIAELELIGLIPLKSKEAQAKHEEIMIKFIGFKKWANEQIDNL